MSKSANESTDLLGACGMDCAACPILKAANDTAFAEQLAEGWRNSGSPNAKAEWFRCQGCHGPEALIWSGDCKIRACCVKGKNLKNCSQCAEFPCNLSTAFENDGNPNHQAAVNRLRRMKESR